MRCRTSMSVKLKRHPTWWLDDRAFASVFLLCLYAGTFFLFFRISCHLHRPSK